MNILFSYSNPKLVLRTDPSRSRTSIINNRPVPRNGSKSTTFLQKCSISTVSLLMIHHVEEFDRYCNKSFRRRKEETIREGISFRIPPKANKEHPTKQTETNICSIQGINTVFQDVSFGVNCKET